MAKHGKETKNFQAWLDLERQGLAQRQVGPGFIDASWVKVKEKVSRAILPRYVDVSGQEIVLATNGTSVTIATEVKVQAGIVNLLVRLPVIGDGLKSVGVDTGIVVTKKETY